MLARVGSKSTRIMSGGKKVRVLRIAFERFLKGSLFRRQSEDPASRPAQGTFGLRRFCLSACCLRVSIA